MSHDHNHPPPLATSAFAASAAGRLLLAMAALGLLWLAVWWAAA